MDRPTLQDVLRGLLERWDAPLPHEEHSWEQGMMISHEPCQVCDERSDEGMNRLHQRRGVAPDLARVLLEYDEAAREQAKWNRRMAHRPGKIEAAIEAGKRLAQRMKGESE